MAEVIAAEMLLADAIEAGDEGAIAAAQEAYQVAAKAEEAAAEAMKEELTDEVEQTQVVQTDDEVEEKSPEVTEVAMEDLEPEEQSQPQFAYEDEIAEQEKAQEHQKLWSWMDRMNQNLEAHQPGVPQYRILSFVLSSNVYVCLPICMYMSSKVCMSLKNVLNVMCPLTLCLHIRFDFPIHLSF